MTKKKKQEQHNINDYDEDDGQLYDGATWQHSRIKKEGKKNQASSISMVIAHSDEIVLKFMFK